MADKDSFLDMYQVNQATRTREARRLQSPGPVSYPSTHKNQRAGP